jgi:hypothetical protein
MPVPEKRDVGIRCEDAIVWVKSIEGLRWVREGWVLYHRRRGMSLKGNNSDIIGFGELCDRARGVNRYFMRRVFRVRVYDRQQHPSRIPSEAISIASVRPGFRGTRIMPQLMIAAAARQAMPSMTLVRPVPARRNTPDSQVADSQQDGADCTT